MESPALVGVIQRMPGASYAVCWSRPDEPPAVGKATPTATALELSGNTDGRSLEKVISYEEITSVRIERAGPLRLRDQPTIVLDRGRADLVLILPLGAGLLHELTRLLTKLATGHLEGGLAIVPPLEPGSLKDDRFLEGPPFDPPRGTGTRGRDDRKDESP